MRVMVIIKAAHETEAGVLPDETLIAEMGRYNEQLVNAGMMLAGEGLHPSSAGVRIDFSDQEQLSSFFSGEPACVTSY